jgi:hypothetical protein
VFSAGNLIHFTPFYFKNGQTAPKNKYFIVLKNKGEGVIIASLPTSINHLPNFLTAKHGCINDDSVGVNCYLFEQNRTICENGFCFPFHTYVHGYEVSDYLISTLEKVYTTENKDYKILGKLKEEELSALIKCIVDSGSIKNRIKKWLQ